MNLEITVRTLIQMVIYYYGLLSLYNFKIDNA